MSKAILAFNSFFAPKGKITALHSLFFFLNQWTSRGLPTCMRGGEGWGSDGGVECLAGTGLGDGQKEPLKLCLSLTRMVLVVLNMLQMCPKLPGQQFVDPPFEEEILTFIRELGYSGNIKLLSDVKVDILPQPWRTFGTIINKCLSGKVTGIDSLRLSRAQILWGLYHQMKVDYVYLLWEDLVFQIENKESRKTKYMFYPRFTKVIINHFMSQDQSIPRRNKVD
ncbi:hypothetical protein Tco_0162731 [Tanacetum coccineum]